MAYYEKLSIENYFGPNQLVNHPANHGIVVEKSSGSGGLNHSSSFELTSTDTTLNKYSYVPAVVPIPTIRADDRDLALKKYLTSQQKFLGIGATSFFILLFTLLTLLTTSCGIFVYITYHFITDEAHMHEWKLFGIIVSSASILVTLIVLIFVLAYSKARHEKYRRALRIELDNTDESGNTIRLASLSRIYRQFFSNEPTAQATVSVTASNNQLNKALLAAKQPLPPPPPPLQLQHRSDSKIALDTNTKPRILSSSTATNRQVRQSMSSDDTDLVRIDESTSSGVISSSGCNKMMGVSPITMTTSRSNYVAVKQKQSSRSTNRITPVDNYY